MFKLVIPTGTRSVISGDTLVSSVSQWAVGQGTIAAGSQVGYGKLVYEANMDNTDKPPFQYSIINSTYYNKYLGAKKYAIGDIVWYTEQTPVRIKRIYGEINNTGITPKVKLPIGYDTVKLAGVAKIVNSDVALYMCTAASTGNLPTNTDFWKQVPTYWSALTTDNYYACEYDKNVPNSLNNSSLTYSEVIGGDLSLRYTYTPGDQLRPTGVFLLNAQSDYITVTLTDLDTTEIVQTTTLSSINYANITDWYQWFFAPFEYITSQYIALPNIASPQIDITLGLNEDTALTSTRLGLCYVGYDFNMGDTLFAPTVSLTDYSTKGYDDYGNLSIEEGAYQREYEFQVKVSKSHYDMFIDTIVKYRATPLVWVLDDQDSNSIVYGYVSDFSIQYQTTNYAFVSLTLQSI